MDVVPRRRKPLCGICGRKVRKNKDRYNRYWRHLDLFGVRTYLRYSIRRVVCRRLLRGKASTLRLLNHFGILDPRRIPAGGICRVGMAGRSTTPLTEPDLWASHPALWNEFFMVKQRKLTRDQLHSV